MDTLPTPHSLDALTQQAVQYMKSDIQRAFDLGVTIQQQALSLNPPYRKGEGCGLFVQGVACYYRAEYETAKNHLSLALQIFQDIEDVEWQTTCLTPLGATYRQLGDLPSALVIHHEQLEIARSILNSPAEMRAMNGIASVYHQLGEYEDALEYLKQAQVLAQFLYDTTAEAVILGNMCDEYVHVGRYAEALEVGLKSLAMFEKVTANPTEYINTVRNLGITYRRMGDLKTAIEYLDQARQMAELYHLENYYLIVMQQLGEIAFQQGDIAPARLYLHQVISRAKATGSERSVYGSFYTLAEMYRKEGKFETALHYMEQYYTLKEAIFNKESDQRIKVLEQHFRTEAARKEAELYRQRTHEQENLREQEKQAYERLTHLKNEFIRSATHDLKNPISSIKLLLHLIDRHGQTQDGRGRELWQRLLMQIDVIQALVSDMLDYARLETGHALELTSEKLHPAIAELLDEARAIASKRDIRLNIQNQLAEDVSLLSDSTRLTQALRGLLRYILTRMPEHAALHIEAVGQRGSKIALRLLISDWYIEKEDLDNLFKPFFRARSFDDKPSQGSGLGLALVNAIIEQHGGQITASSHRETGTRFQVALPAEVMQPAG